MGLQRYSLVLAVLLIIALGCIAAPVSAADHTLNPGDSIQENITAAGIGDTIILNPGTYTEHDIIVDKTIIIRANTSAGGNPANTIIDAEYAGRIFDSSGGAYSLAIDNLTLQNGQVTGNGSAIYSPVGGTLTLTSSAFSNCSATESGGAIFAAGGILTITSSTFSDCSATLWGGAVESYSSLTITSSTFSNCSATDGGAVDSYDSTVIITSSTFTDCSATEWGGAVESYSSLTITSSTFSNCSATNGGAVDSYDSTVIITSSTFTDCSATYGGAIGVTNSTLTFTSSAITDCSAGWGGGAIFTFSDSSTLIITSSSFSNCTALISGAIFASGTTTITSSTFSDCSAFALGGAISASGTTTITSSTFSDCSVLYLGGALFASGSLFDDTTSPFPDFMTDYGSTIPASGDRSHSATSFTFPDFMTDYGSTIPAPGNGSHAATSSTFSDFMTDYESAVSAPGDGSVVVNSSTFSNCSAINIGGAISAEDISVTITDSTFSNNSASDQGGAVDSYNSTVIIRSSTFTGCSATNGSVIFNDPPGSTATLHFCRIYQNTIPAVYNSGGPVDAENNWWGSNADPSGFVYGTVDYTPWLVLGATATPDSIANTWHSVIGAQLTFNSDGTDTSGGGIYLPDGITSTFAMVSGSGSVSPGTAGTANGVASTLYTPTGADQVNISATVDDQTVYVSLRVEEAVPGYTPYSSNGGDDGPPAILPLMTVTVNIGGNSGVGKATVAGTKLSELIVTGTVQPGPGTNLNAPPGIVYQYISLVPARYNTITSAVINFSVPQSWLDEHHIAPGSIVLYHQTANGWEALPTTLLYTKDGTVYFSAQTTGFSLFAITGTPPASTPVTTVKTTAIVSSPVLEQTPVQVTTIREPVTTQTTAPPATSAPPSAPFPIMDIILVIAAVVVLGAGGFLFRRWWVRRQNPALFREYD